MPKKMNRYEMQNYVPEGNADGGQYTFDGGSSNGGGGNKSDSSPKANVKTHKEFNEYIENNHNSNFGKALTENFDMGNDDAKTIINDLIKKGVKIEESKNGECYFKSGRAVVIGDIDNFGEFSAEVKGETFYHEFWHAADYSFCRKFLTNGEKFILAGRYGMKSSYYNRDLSTAKILSNGKTLLDTLNEECHKISVNRAGGKWEKIVDDYEEEINSGLVEFDVDKIMKIRSDIYQEAISIFPKFDEDGVYLEENEKKREEWLNSNEKYNKEFNDYKEARAKIRAKALRHWGNISDIYGLYKKIPYGFAHMGHPSSYAKEPGSIAREFMAEYGSARSRNDDDGKKELALFKKYFPDTSKCAEEIFNMVLKEARNNG